MKTLKIASLGRGSSVRWFLARGPGCRTARVGCAPIALGWHIHFCRSKPGEMKMLAQGGFRWCAAACIGTRRNLSWENTTSATADRLVGRAKNPIHSRAVLLRLHQPALRARHVADQRTGPRQAFVRWAVAAVHRYRNRASLWEMYNEPNNNVVRSGGPRPAGAGLYALAFADANRGRSHWAAWTTGRHPAHRS